MKMYYNIILICAVVYTVHALDVDPNVLPTLAEIAKACPSDSTVCQLYTSSYTYLYLSHVAYVQQKVHVMA
jgi:hypothetical protein